MRDRYFNGIETSAHVERYSSLLVGITLSLLPSPSPPPAAEGIRIGPWGLFFWFQSRAVAAAASAAIVSPYQNRLVETSARVPTIREKRLIIWCIDSLYVSPSFMWPGPILGQHKLSVFNSLMIILFLGCKDEDGTQFLNTLYYKYFLWGRGGGQWTHKIRP